MVDAATVRAKKGDFVGPNPVDRGKPGSKIHVLTDRASLPLSVAVSGANINDCDGLKRAIPAIGSRCGPRRRRPDKPHADKAYDHPSLRRWSRDRGIVARIARRGIDTSPRLGRHRRVVERTLSRLTNYRRLHHYYERRADLLTPSSPSPQH